MCPVNRGPLVGPRIPPVGVRPPPVHRFGGRILPPGIPPPIRQRMPIAPMSLMYGPPVPRPGPGNMIRPGVPPPLFHSLGRGIPPMPHMPLRGGGPRGPPIRHWPRRMPPQMLGPMGPMGRYSMANGNMKGKGVNNIKKVSRLEELELKKPWMTDEIRSEIQKKNKLYAKAKKNKDAKEWEEFKDLRNKVTRMIRDAKNEYLSKHTDQGSQKTSDKNANESEGVQKTENVTEQSEQMEIKEELQPTSEQA